MDYGWIKAEPEHFQSLLIYGTNSYLGRNERSRLMMENLNSGYVALAFVGIVFFGLQFWWISMTIRNGTNERALVNQNQTDEIKNRLEKIFAKSE